VAARKPAPRRAKRGRSAEKKPTEKKPPVEKKESTTPTTAPQEG
jgi:hypothetical protein